MARGGLSFSDGFTSRRAGSMSGGAAAAGNASVAETFGALEGTKPDTAGMGATAVEAESYKRRAASAADASARAQALKSIGSVVAFDKQMSATAIIGNQRNGRRVIHHGNRVNSRAIDNSYQ